MFICARDSTWTRPALAGDEQVFVAFDKTEREELIDSAAIEPGLEGPVEAGHRLAHLQPAAFDAPLNAALALETGRGSEQSLNRLELARPMLLYPRQVTLDVEAVQFEPLEVLLDFLQDFSGGS